MKSLCNYFYQFVTTLFFFCSKMSIKSSISHYFMLFFSLLSARRVLPSINPEHERASSIDLNSKPEHEHLKKDRAPSELRASMCSGRSLKKITNVILVENLSLDHNILRITSRHSMKDKEITNVILVENPSLNQDLWRNISRQFIMGTKTKNVTIKLILIYVRL